MISRVSGIRISKNCAVAAVLFSALAATANAEPEVSTANGELVNGGTVVVNGSRFTTKARAKPLFWWHADGGDRPSSLGRTSDWADAWDERDVPKTNVVAPGSSRSYGFHHGDSSGAALGRVDYDSNRMYFWRKKYDAFDVTRDYALRIFVRWTEGSNPAPGYTMVGQESGAVGVIQRVTEDNNNRWNLKFDIDKGTIAEDASPRISFIKDEVVEWPGGKGIFLSGLKTFNFKTFRIWPVKEDGSRAKGSSAVITALTKREYGRYIEGVTIGGGRGIDLFQTENQWKIEQLEWGESSAPDVEDGTFSFSIDNQWPMDDKFGLTVTRNAKNPYPKGQLYMSQVSNGAKPGSWVYYDALYVDETWHRVLLSAYDRYNDAWDLEVQIPSAWNDNRIEFNVRLGSLDPTGPLYLYVVDGEGRVNHHGFPIGCPKCPMGPVGSVD